MTTDDRIPVLFIHGLWLHASSWQPWLDLFEKAGYAPLAPGYPGEAPTVDEARAFPDRVANRGVDDLVDHFKHIVEGLPSQPILIGHSFGGLVAQKLLGEGIGRAAIAISPAQMKGVLTLPFAQLRAGFPALGNPMNKRRAVALTQSEFRYGFGNALSEDESNALFEAWSIPSPVRGLFEVAFANFTFNAASEVDTANASRGPLLLISGLEDHTVPDATTRSSYRQYKESGAITELKQFAGRGHSLTVDGGWHEVATACLQWLQAKRLGGQPRESARTAPREVARTTFAP